MPRYRTAQSRGGSLARPRLNRFAGHRTGVFGYNVTAPGSRNATFCLFHRSGPLHPCAVTPCCQAVLATGSLAQAWHSTCRFSDCEGEPRMGGSKAMRTMTVKMEQDQAVHCDRCSGLMVPERLSDLDVEGWRCVVCGEFVDPVIMAHRRAHPQAVGQEQAQQVGRSRAT